MDTYDNTKASAYSIAWELIVAVRPDIIVREAHALVESTAGKSAFEIIAAAQPTWTVREVALKAAELTGEPLMPFVANNEVRAARQNPDGEYTQTRADGSIIYWRTGRGSHRHASAYCANGKRSIHTGDVFVIPQAEALDWAPCLDCCTEAEVASAREAAEAKAAALCSNPGVDKPQRIYSTCRACGKEGKVNRSTGKIKAHKPAA